MRRSGLIGTTEILGAILGGVVKDSRAFRCDPKSYIFSRTSYDVGVDVSVAVVENSTDLVHLALPYYVALDRFSATGLVDSAVDDISGGFEVVWSLIAAAAVTAVVFGGIGGGLMVTDSDSESDEILAK